MSKRTWLVFAAIQAAGCTLAAFGTVYSESAVIRASWLIGFLLLLPGNLPAMAVSQTLIHVRTADIFFPIAVACNALLWILCAALWRMLSPKKPEGNAHRYGTALGTTALVFVILNTVHFLRPATCADCFFRYPMRLVTNWSEEPHIHSLARQVGCTDKLLIDALILVGRPFTRGASTPK